MQNHVIGKMNTLRIIILIGLGGGIGSISRYLTTLCVQKYYAGIFPLATLILNMLGCLLIGVLLGCLERYQCSNQTDLKFLFITGFCGGYTTFSAFAFENVTLLQSDHAAYAFAYIGLSVMVGLAATWAGLSLVKIF